MSALLQICLVIGTIAVVAIAVAMIRMSQHFREASTELSELARESRVVLEEVRVVAREAGEIVASLRQVAPRVHGVVASIESIGVRVTSLSDAVLQEVEVPLRTAVAVARGFRHGALDFVGRLANRFAGRLAERWTGRMSANGGSNDE